MDCLWFFFFWVFFLLVFLLFFILFFIIFFQFSLLFSPIFLHAICPLQNWQEESLPNFCPYFPSNLAAVPSNDRSLFRWLHSHAGDSWIIFRIIFSLLIV